MNDYITRRIIELYELIDKLNLCNKKALDKYKKYRKELEELKEKNTDV